MFWAHDENGSPIQASPGVRGLCPMCGGEVHSRTGELVTWHFAHSRGHILDCDRWWEHEGYWHLKWKEAVPPHMREYVIRRDVRQPNGSLLETVHRADILNGRGMVIELQHSPLTPSVVREREQFYENMIWIFDFTDPVRRSRFHFKRSGDHHTFIWKRPLRWMFAASRPVFLDLGGMLFCVKRFSNTAPSHGWGYYINKNAFMQIYFV